MALLTAAVGIFLILCVFAYGPGLFDLAWKFVIGPLMLLAVFVAGLWCMFISVTQESVPFGVIGILLSGISGFVSWILLFDPQ